MTPLATDSNPTNYHFGQLGRRQVVANFSGGNSVDYVLGFASNERLQRMTYDLERNAKAEFERCQTVEPPLRPTPWFRSLNYRTFDSWSQYRRVVCKLTYDTNGVKRRFVVTH